MSTEKKACRNSYQRNEPNDSPFDMRMGHIKKQNSPNWRVSLIGLIKSCSTEPLIRRSKIFKSVLSFTQKFYYIGNYRLSRCCFIRALALKVPLQLKVCLSYQPAYLLELKFFHQNRKCCSINHLYFFPYQKAV